jgi:nitrogen regulatory protein PII
MKLIVAIIRPDRLNEVLEALYHAEVRGLTVSRVLGHGGETDRVETYRGTTVKMELQEKVRLEIGVSRVRRLTVKAIPASAHRRSETASLSQRARPTALQRGTSRRDADGGGEVEARSREVKACPRCPFHFVQVARSPLAGDGQAARPAPIRDDPDAARRRGIMQQQRRSLHPR